MSLLKKMLMLTFGSGSGAAGGQVFSPFNGTDYIDDVLIPNQYTGNASAGRQITNGVNLRGGFVSGVAVGLGGEYAVTPQVIFNNTGTGGSGATATAVMTQSGTGGQDLWNINGVSSGPYTYTVAGGLPTATPGVGSPPTVTPPSTSVTGMPYYRSTGLITQGAIGPGPMVDGTYTLSPTTGDWDPAADISVTVSGGVVTGYTVGARGQTFNSGTSTYWFTLFHLGPAYTESYMQFNVPVEPTGTQRIRVTVFGGAIPSSSGTVLITVNGGSSPGWTFFANARTQISSSYPLYRVSSVTVNDGGSNYSTPPLVTFSENGGATATAVITAGVGSKQALVWLRSRTQARGHQLYDTRRGVTQALSSDTAASAVTVAAGLTNFTTTGFTLGSDVTVNGASPESYQSLTFCEASNFFQIVPYAGNGVAGRVLAHTLGASPGLILVKATSGADADWAVYHRSATGDLVFNTTAAQAGSRTKISAADMTTFTVDASANVNANGRNYVAYLFSHDTTASGAIQCGTYTGNGSTTGPVVDLGWEPQYVLVKALQAPSSPGNWWLVDVWRGMSVDGVCQTSVANATTIESTTTVLRPTARGFQVLSNGVQYNQAGIQYAYMAIRRPNRTRFTGADVFTPVARAGTAGAISYSSLGYAPDLVLSRARNSNTANSYNTGVHDRLRGRGLLLQTNTTSAEIVETVNQEGLLAFTTNGVNLGTDAAQGTLNQAFNYINEFFRRSPGFLDSVGFSVTAPGVTTVQHSLGRIPDLMLIKDRQSAGDYLVYSTPTSAGYLKLNSSGATFTDRYYWTLGAVTDVTVDAQGGGYLTAPLVSMPGGATATAVLGNGELRESTQTVSYTASTSLFGPYPDTAVTFPAPPAGPGARTAQGYVTADGQAYSVPNVRRLVITDPGFGYASGTIPWSVAPAVAPSEVTSGTIRVASQVVDVNVTAVGNGYASAPAVTFDNTGTGGTGAAATAVLSLGSYPTSTSFTIQAPVGGRYSAHLFGSLAGVSKIGSYIGTGTTKVVDCGFAAGARFVLLKRLDAPGDWLYWDTARGIIAGNDPHLSLNTTAVEVTTNDSIDPVASGFSVNQVAATNANVSGGRYLFIAFA